VCTSIVREGRCGACYRIKKYEENEIFYVNLSNLQANGVNASITADHGQGKIFNDDPLSPISFLGAWDILSSANASAIDGNFVLDYA
jgi:hypothetical protein